MEIVADSITLTCSHLTWPAHCLQINLYSSLPIFSSPYLWQSRWRRLLKGILADHLPGLVCIIRKRGSIDFSPAKLCIATKNMPDKHQDSFQPWQSQKSWSKCSFLSSFIKAKLEKDAEVRANIPKSSMIPNTLEELSLSVESESYGSICANHQQSSQTHHSWVVILVSCNIFLLGIRFVLSGEKCHIAGFSSVCNARSIRREVLGGCKLKDIKSPREMPHNNAFKMNFVINLFWEDSMKLYSHQKFQQVV